MTVKPWAGFIADFPDDESEDERGVVVCGGRNVAEALGEILTGLGCRVLPPEYAGVKGWEFVLYYKTCMFWCQVTSYHPVFQLFFGDTAIFRGTRAKNVADYSEVAFGLAAALASDSRFHNVVWRSKEDGPPEPDEILPFELQPPLTVQTVERLPPRPPPRPRDFFKRPSFGRSLRLILIGVAVMAAAGVLDANGQLLGIAVLPIGAFALIGGLLGLQTWRRSRFERAAQTSERDA
jgi:hypothetical protein